MVRSRGLIMDLELCVGCFACQLACKQQNKLPVGINWINVSCFGPSNLDGRMCMDFFLDVSDECKLCGECAATCPTKALRICRDDAEILELLRSKRRYQICHIAGK